ncbi:MAG: OB-fold nucleic acid binding domain-containing protein, partial [Candidatus Buchananbacteria bacterium]
EFMAALLTADQQNLDRIAIEVDECRQMGIEVLAPDINESFADFGVVANSLTTGKPRIRFGLLAVKGLGENIVAEIIKERKANGIYNNLEDLLTRVKSKDLNKRSLEAMAKAGVMDTLLERNAILHNMDRLLSFVNEFNKGANSSQDSLFSATSSINIAKLKLDKIAPLDKKQKLTWEKELLGLYISEHPMADISQVVRNYAVSCSTLKNCADGSEVRVAGVIFTIKKINTKKGDAMLFVKIEDTAGDVEILVFPKVLAANPHMWQPDTIVIVSGTVSDKDGERKVLCDSAVILNTANLKETLDNFLVQSRDNKSKTRRFNFGDKSFGGGERIAGEVKVKEAPAILDKIINLKLSHPLDFDISRQLKELILKHQGNHLLELIVTRGEAKEKIRTTFRINYCDEFRQAAEKLLGEGIMEEIKA